MRLLRLLLLWVLCVSMVTSRRCCPEGEPLLTKTKRCANTTDHPLLACPQGKYVLDPNRHTERDKFEIKPDGKLHTDSFAVDEDRYCVTLLVYRNDTTTKDDVAFVCFPDKDDTQGCFKAHRYLINGILISISTFFMLLMLLVYALLPEMRDLEGKCLVSYVGSLCTAFVILAALQFTGSRLSTVVCSTAAFLEYFWMLSAFFWLFVVSFNIWRTVQYGNSARSESRTYLLYCACGWGCPLLFLIVALVVQHLPTHLDLVRPLFGHKSCWFPEQLETWSYFYGPVAVLLACNVGFFVSTAWGLWRNCRDHTAMTLTFMKFKCLLYAKLFVAMGILWIFEVLSYVVDPHGNTPYWCATDYLNALQGIPIFVITVVFRKRVLRGLSQHKTCGIPWPKKWAEGADAESHAILPNEDVEIPMTNGSDKILS